LAQGMSPTESGLLLMPGGFIMVLAFPLSGRLSDRYDKRLLISGGIVFFALAFWLMAGADAGTSFWTFAFWVVLSRIGIGLVMPALQMGALAGIDVSRINSASGSFSFARQMGGAFGVNLSSIILEQRTAMHREVFADTQTYANGDTMEVLQSLSALTRQMGFVGTDSWNAARGLLQQMLQSQALIAGFKDSFLLLMLVFLLVLIPTWMLRNSKGN
jgi:DHA2 family multidrug resistance protein